MQENKSMIESVRDYFLECPILKDGHLYIDYLNEKPTDYSIDPLVCSPIVKKYSDGGSLRRYQFAFMSSEVYSQSEIENMQNSGFYERLAEWIETQNKINNLPAFQDVEVLLTSTNKILKPLFKGFFNTLNLVYRICT